MALLLTERDVTELLTMPDTLVCVEEAFRLQGLGLAQNQPRQRLRPARSTLHLMAASLPSLGVMGYKAYTTTRAGAKFHVLLYSTETGELLALIEADRLGQMRTGAASGVAAKYLARADAGALACIGAGHQAETQLLAVCAVRPIESVRVFSRDPGRRDAFAQRMAALLGLPVRAVASAEAAVRDAAIVCTATTARAPVLLGSWLAPGAHVNAAGANSLTRAEIDAEAVRKAALVVTDSREQARLECGDLLPAVERNLIRWEQVGELGAIVAGRAPGRRQPDEITLFESQGIALEDIAAARWVLDLARQRGRGQPMNV